MNGIGNMRALPSGEIVSRVQRKLQEMAGDLRIPAEQRMMLNTLAVTLNAAVTRGKQIEDEHV